MTHWMRMLYFLFEMRNRVVITDLFEKVHLEQPPVWTHPKISFTLSVSSFSLELTALCVSLFT